MNEVAHSTASLIDPLMDSRTLAQLHALVTQLSRHKTTLSTAESCTGGLLGAAITSFSGTSAVFIGGVNAYSNDMKQHALSVPKMTMIDHGAVSEPVALAMALGVQRLSGSDWALGLTGVAGPGGGSAEKPVGYVCFAIASAQGQRQAWHKHFTGSRQQIRQAAVYDAAAGLIDALGEPGELGELGEVSS